MFPFDIYLFKVNNGNARNMREICPKLSIKTPERRIVNFEQISHIVLVIPLLKHVNTGRVINGVNLFNNTKKPQYWLKKSKFKVWVCRQVIFLLPSGILAAMGVWKFSLVPLISLLHDKKIANWNFQDGTIKHKNMVQGFAGKKLLFNRIIIYFPMLFILWIAVIRNSTNSLKGRAQLLKRPVAFVKITSITLKEKIFYSDVLYSDICFSDLLKIYNVIFNIQ